MKDLLPSSAIPVFSSARHPSPTVPSVSLPAMRDSHSSPLWTSLVCSASEADSTTSPIRSSIPIRPEIKCHGIVDGIICDSAMNLNVSNLTSPTLDQDADSCNFRH